MSAEAVEPDAVAPEATPAVYAPDASATEAPAPAAPQSGQSPGARLRAERERRGLSVQRAADDLHLDPWVIEALEADDHSRLGPAVYVKGHLRHYATLLGLSCDSLLADLAAPPSAPLAPTAAPSPGLGVTVRPGLRLGKTSPVRQVAAGAAILAVLVGGWWWKPWQRPAAAPPLAAAHDARPAAGPVAIDAAVATAPSDTAVPTPVTPAPTVQATAAPTPAAPAPSVQATAAPTPAAPAPTVQATDGPGRVVLRLSFSADSWVDVRDAAGRRLFAGLGRANTVKTLAGAAPLKVHLGYASGVQLEVNQHAVAIGSEFLTGDVARFDAGADGVLRRDRPSADAPAPAGASAPLPPTVRGAARRRPSSHG